MAVDKAKLRKTITAILEDADLDTVSAKKVRQQVEAKLKVDLTDRKKEVDDLVMEIVDEKQDANKSEGSDEEEDSKSKGKRRAAKKDDSEEGSEDEYEPEGKKAKGKKAGSDSEEEFGKKKKTGKAKAAPKKGGGGTGFTKTLRLSPELASVMGEESMARHEVVKKMWSIIKEKNLYDPKNKQFAICDEKLLPVFGVKRFRTFGMMKYLKNHFID